MVVCARDMLALGEESELHLRRCSRHGRPGHVIYRVASVHVTCAPVDRCGRSVALSSLKLSSFNVNVYHNLLKLSESMKGIDSET